MTAIGLLLIGVFVLSFQDSMVKYLSGDTSYWQFQTLRSLGNIAIAIMLAKMSGGLSLLRPRNAPAVYLRAGFLTITMFFFFAGAPYLSVAQMAAGLYTYPIFVTMFAAPVLGERIGVWRAGAVLLGAAGAAVVLSPWDAGFRAVQLLPLAAGFFYACNVLTLRRACRHESPLALALAVAVLMFASGLLGAVSLSTISVPAEIVQANPFLAVGWPELTLFVVGFALLASILNLAGNISLSRAYQTADASMLAPLDFIYLLYAAVWSKLLFDQWPSSEAIVGMVLIASAGALTVWREHVRK